MGTDGPAGSNASPAPCLAARHLGGLPEELLQLLPGLLARWWAQMLLRSCLLLLLLMVVPGTKQRLLRRQLLLARAGVVPAWLLLQASAARLAWLLLQQQARHQAQPGWAGQVAQVAVIAQHLHHGGLLVLVLVRACGLGRWHWGCVVRRGP